jgi:hypothetical protein
VGVVEFHRPFDAPVADAAPGAGADGAGEAVGDAGVVTGHGAEAVLVAEEVGGGGAEVADYALHLGAVDELLPFQYAAKQQADDDQHHCDFDEGEAALPCLHF